MTKRGILLINLGTPKSPTTADVRVYLRKFLGDKRVIDMPRVVWKPILETMVLPKRPAKSAALYQKIWTAQGSPLAYYTESQRQKLQDRFPDVIVREAYSYSEPLIPTALAALEEAGVDDLVIIPLYPQYSTTTVGSVLDEITGFFHERTYIPNLRVVTSFYDHPTYVQLLAKKIRAKWDAGNYDRLLLSYHGIPKSYVDKGDRYVAQCEETTALLKEALGDDVAVYHSYQSKFGPAEWVGPATDATLKEWGQAGLSALVCSPSFISDCLETVHELGIENRGYFEEAGGKDYGVVDCLNDDDDFIDFLAALVENRPVAG